ncbi:MAG: hypothetical protein H8M99_07740, partial [Gloeobacteraceae cyanobacterium ES-bin-144]|nr:hypothetical protein [Verrucomicrobiales bacterium]
MKTFSFYITALFLMFGSCHGQEVVSYTNYLRQFQMPGGITWDASDTVQPNGTQLSALAINPGGARFDLATIKSSSLTGLTEYPLDTAYVGTYVPLATVAISSEDNGGVVRRTRADRPFSVVVTVSGLLSGPTDPEPSKSVKFNRYVQSYGTGTD